MKKMKRHITLKHEFVDYIPDNLKDGVVYVSVMYATAIHKCCCGCGREVVTPFSPTDWKLMFDGQTISLDPSVGNWSFPCQSHYWIRQNKVEWDRRWSRAQIEAGRTVDRRSKEAYFATSQGPADSSGTTKANKLKGLWRKLKKWWF